MKKILGYLFNLNQVRKIRTELYPDPVSSRGEEDLPSRARGGLINYIPDCIGCAACVDVCPTQCIELVNGPSTYGRPNVETFNIDFSKCIGCGECVSVCEPRSLRQLKVFVRPVSDVKKLTKKFCEGRQK